MPFSETERRRRFQTRHSHTCFRIRHQRGASGINEFALVFIVLIMIIFPIINLCGLACGYATLALATFRGVTRAAAAPNFPASLDGMEEDVMQVSTCGLGRFVKLKPVAGFRSCGSDLFTLRTNIYNNQMTRFGPNVPPPAPINSTDNVYEFQTQTTFDVGPIVSMASVPMVSAVPGLGKPARLTCAWTAAVEHPLGLSASQQAALSGGGSPLKLLVTGLETPGTLTEFSSDSGWNYPQIYQLILQAGQTVVDEEVVRVEATNPNWTPVNVDIQPGDKIWIDYRADGMWNCNTNSPNYTSDANGLVGRSVSRGGCNGWPMGSMIGKVGTSGTPVLLGKQQWNMVPPGTGQFFMMCNDQIGFPGDANYTPWHVGDNAGAMIVRVIITR